MKTSPAKRALVKSFGNPIVEYCDAIRSGDVVVSLKVQKVYFKLERIIKEGHPRWRYDEHKANHALTFVQTFCRHSKGKWGGKPVVLELWQRAYVAGIFGFVDKETGLRKHTKALLVVGRKNGKSTLAAAIGLYMQTADGEPGPEIYSVATKKDQAKIIWLEARRMVRKSPALRKRLKCLVAEIVGEYNDSFFKFLGSDSDTLDGLNPHCALGDEIHAWRDQNLFDVIYDGMTAREQPLFLETTTAGTVREAVYDTEYDAASKAIDEVDGFEDDRLFAVIYELDARAEWTDEACWQKANPGLGTIKDRQKLAEKVKRAKANPAMVKNLLCKEFNIAGTATDSWLTFEEANNTAEFDVASLRGMYAIGGVDLSSTTDLTCATLIVVRKGDPVKYVLQQYFMPGELAETRMREDGKVPYDKWHERGLLTYCAGHKVRFTDVTDWFWRMHKELGIHPMWIYFDRWSAQYWVDEMKDKFGDDVIGKNTECAMGARTLSQPMKEMYADLCSKLINYGNNPILKWCLTNVAIEQDKNENIRPIKGKNQRLRIDGAVSLLIAYTGLFERWSEYKDYLKAG